MTKYTNPGVICGDQNFIIPPHVNYGKFLVERLLLAKKENIALIDGASDEKVSYGELAKQALNIAASLKKLGVKTGDVIGICSENRSEVLITAIGAFYTGAIVTFVNRAYSKDEFVHTMKISKPRFMLLSPKTYTSYHETIKHIGSVKTIIVFGTEILQGNIVLFKHLMSSGIDVNLCKGVDFNGSEQTALILYSSGTTGLPKGAKLSHRNLIMSGIQPPSVKENAVILTIAPWSNTIGLILTLHELIGNKTIIYLNKFVEDTYYKCIEKYQVGMLLTVPPLMVMLGQSQIIKNYNVSSVQFMYCGGAPMNEGIIIEAKKKFKNMKCILQGYGTTETTGAITEEREHASRQGSVGTVCEGLFIKVVDVDSRKILGPNQPGEVCVKGPLLFQGYIGKDLTDDLDDEGYYKTGDIAYYDEDGYFYIVDRLKELIKYKAGQVAPSELEAILILHPAVKDVGVIGTPDPKVGELPTAFVVKVPGSNISEKELVDFIAPKVSSWKQLRGGVRFVQEIPKTASGKILRRKLRELLTKPVSKL